MTRDQALSKIKKCLALAKSDNPNEAASAMRQAQKLMAEHQLTELDADMASVSESSIKAKSSVATPWETNLSILVSRAFGCSVYSQRQGRFMPTGRVTYARKYVFVGISAAPQVASYAYEVLSRQCAKERAAYIKRQPKNCKSITKTARGDEFAQGWVWGVQGLVTKFTSSEQDAQLITQFIDAKHPNLKVVKVKDRAKGQNVSDLTKYLGYQAGKQANLNRGVGGMAEQAALL